MDTNGLWQYMDMGFSSLEKHLRRNHPYMENTNSTNQVELNDKSKLANELAMVSSYPWISIHQKKK